MAAHPSADNSMDEECPECGHETTHTVSVRILTESRKEENTEFSREPYRIAECLVCGHEKTRRMNNA
jgi:transcription elongation factor Elf1